ncbi:MAG: heavy metal translocating P-type ATPase metal-binding domain-containing protein [Bacteroidetes bacterium]|nr:heavy metal translocating P-type ATPase metal-binding domain-containing protein [Bacteroidota bacterium]
MDFTERKDITLPTTTKQKNDCFHCGSTCFSDDFVFDGRSFCCDGCKLVYEILNNNGLCDYYNIQKHPGLAQIKSIRNGKYGYLDEDTISQKLFKFSDGKNAIVTLYIPGVHCSSCMWLLENLHRINTGIIDSRLNFSAKEVTVHFHQEKISLRSVVELLTTIGYEPYISLEDSGSSNPPKFSKQKIYKLGVAGFCFGNIMMMSFPEYLAHHGTIEHQYAGLFRILNLILSIPVFFYSASEFFVSAWAGLKQKMLNIDAPIVLALVITYARSIYEIFSGLGGGYLDSMSGIVFFMLVGRVVQERAYKSLSFHRDYKSYFPIAVSVITSEGVVSKMLADLKTNDVVCVHHEEIIPADAILLNGKARIDYSFVTGETEPVHVPEGAMLYAGGKQNGEQITIQITKPVAGSYLTSLWNHRAFKTDKASKNIRESVVHTLSTYFTYILLALAAVTALYWALHDPSKILPSVSAMLIVACPCALLLAASYTNSNLLRIFSNNGLFMRDASVIEQFSKVNHIIFDKTGTITQGVELVQNSGKSMNLDECRWVYNIVKSSIHPMSRAMAEHLGLQKSQNVEKWQEVVSQGVSGVVEGNEIRVGNIQFIGAVAGQKHSNFYVRINDKICGFSVLPHLREGVSATISSLQQQYKLSLLSGDNDKQRKALQLYFTDDRTLLFNQQPADKLAYVEKCQKEGDNVLMLGDGLNDAGALQQSNVGITLADDINNFTPGCDAILDAKKIAVFPSLCKLARSSGRMINFAFVVSILYNLIGLTISVQAKMSPMIAAILMPLSTLTIVLISTGLSAFVAKRFGLKI